MKKIILITIVGIIAIIPIQAQTYTDAIDSIFSNVSRTDARTGILYERVLSFGHLTHYNSLEGNPDTSNYAQFKYSVGLSWFSSFNGVSLKFNLNNHLYLQTDFGAHAYLNFLFIPISPTLGADFGTQIYLLYENKFPRRTNIYWMAGGGLNFAGVPHLPYSKQVSLKGGAQAILGIECMAKSVPLSVQVDTRWGYGVIYSTKGVKPWERNGYIADNNPYHFLDYGFVVTLRYHFDKRNNH